MKLKRRHFEKILAAFIVIIMAAALPLNAFAAESDIIDTSRDTSLTIYKYDETAALEAGVSIDGLTADGKRNESDETLLSKYAIKGVEFTYLKVSDIKTVTEGNIIHLAYTIPIQLETVLGLSDSNHTYTSEELSASLADALIDNTATKNSLEDYIKASGGTKMPKTDANGKTTVQSMPQGLYLVVETMVPKDVSTTVNPFFVSLPMTDSEGENWFYDVYAYPKNQTNLPTIDKLVSENGVFDDIATASEGDTVDFRVVSKLPEITSKATYLEKYEFIDNICSGLAYNKDVTIELYNSENDAKQGATLKNDLWPKGSSDFSVTYSDQDKTMIVSLTSSGLAKVNSQYSGKYIVVCYSADVDSSAKVVLGDNGNTNDVKLTYKRTSDTEETIKDRALVYSYGIDLTKRFSGKTGDPTLVQFTLKNASDGYFVTATGSDGVYYVTGDTSITSESEGTVFSPASDGKLLINGLEADQYELVEIKTAPGFSLLKKPISIDFTQTIDSITPSCATMTGIDNPNNDIIFVNLDRASAEVDSESAEMSAFNSSNNARVTLEVINNPGFNLPYTGGTGKTLVTLIGLLIIFMGMLALRKREHEI